MAFPWVDHKQWIQLDTSRATPHKYNVQKGVCVCKNVVAHTSTSKLRYVGKHDLLTELWISFSDRYGWANQPSVLGPRWRVQSFLWVLPGKMTYNIMPLSGLSAPQHTFNTHYIKVVNSQCFSLTLLQC